MFAGTQIDLEESNLIFDLKKKFFNRISIRQIESTSRRKIIAGINSTTVGINSTTVGSSLTERYAKGPSESSSNSNDFISRILSATICHPINIKYPVERDYQRQFVDLLRNLAPNNSRLGNLSTCLANVVGVPDHACDEIDSSAESRGSNHSFKTYFLGAGERSVTMLESRDYVDEEFLTTGLATTSASTILSDWLLHHSSILNERRVLELGSGCGFVGISVVTECRPRSYVFTDYHQKVLSRCRENFLINQKSSCETKVEFRKLDWKKMKKEEWASPVDLILGADIVYDPLLVPDLVSVLKHFLIRRRQNENKKDTKLECRHRNKKVDCNGDNDGDVDCNEDHEVDPLAVFVSAIRDSTTLDFFILCLKNFGLSVEDFEDDQSDDWEFPDRDFFNFSDRDAEFKTLFIRDASSDEEMEMLEVQDMLESGVAEEVEKSCDGFYDEEEESLAPVALTEKDAIVGVAGIESDGNSKLGDVSVNEEDTKSTSFSLSDKDEELSNICNSSTATKNDLSFEKEIIYYSQTLTTGDHEYMIACNSLSVNLVNVATKQEKEL